MESLINQSVWKENAEVEAEPILTEYKEFLLVFYGAGWSAKSHQVAEALSNYLIDQNADDGRSPNNAEAFFISNDESKDDFKDFYSMMLDEAPYWTTLQFGDARIVQLKNSLQLETVP